MSEIGRVALSMGAQEKLQLAFHEAQPVNGKLHLCYNSVGKLQLAYVATQKILASVPFSLPFPPMPKPLSMGNRAFSTPVASPPPPALPLRRMRSEPPPEISNPGGQRFTDRLLLLLTRETTSDTSVQFPVASFGFGEDPPLRPSASKANGTCSICLDDKDATVQLCWNTSCKDRFCEECVAGFAKAAVERSVYTVPWLHCPACNGRIPTRSWCELAPEAYAQYQQHAEAMLHFRCGDCHETGNLCVENSSGPAGINTYGSSVAEGLCKAWPAFAYASSTAETLCDLLLGASFDDIDAALRCIQDVERRTCLHLAWLRSHPFITTPCCDTEFCFKCKVGTHHDGQTCEERQREELDIFCQFCPDCEVPTVRTEGCDHIVCLCGAEWTWQEVLQLGWALGPVRHLRELLTNGTLDANWQNDEDDGATLLMSAAGAGMLENTTALLEAGADATVRTSSRVSAIIYAFGYESGIHSPQIVDLLLARGSEVSREDPFIWMASQGSAGSDCRSMFERLLKLSRVVATDLSCPAGESFMDIAVRCSRTSMVKHLLTIGVPVHAKAPFRFLRGYLRDIELFDKIFVASGASIEDKDDDWDDKTLLQISQEKSLANFVTHLVVKHQAKAFFWELARSPGSLWPPECCVLPISVFDALLEQGADPWEEKPLGAGAETRGFLLELLLKAVPYYESQLPRRRPPIKANVDAIFIRLLSQWNTGADLFAKTSGGALSLSDAAHLARWDVCHRLIEAKAPLDAESTDFASRVHLSSGRGLTPVLSATKHGALDMVKLLLNSQCDILATDEKDVMKIARASLNPEGVALLQQAVDEKLEEQARKLAHSGDGTVENVGIKLNGQIQCPDCRQRFDSDQAMKIHWRFIHDPNRHQED